MAVWLYRDKDWSENSSPENIIDFFIKDFHITNEETEITFTIDSKQSKPEQKTIAVDWKTLSWSQPRKRPTIPGLTVYARVDGSFAVWDPIKQLVAAHDSIRPHLIERYLIHRPVIELGRVGRLVRCCLLRLFLGSNSV